MLDRRALLLAGAASAWPARAARYERGLLWRVTPRGGPPSHLYGTLHLDEPAAKAFAAPVREALATARVFRPELRSDDLSGRVFAAATRLPPGPGLRALTGEPLFERVASLLLAHHRLPPRAADRLKPWAAFLQLNQPAEPPGQTVDAALEALARDLGTPVEPIESVDEQIAALEAIPLGSQLTLLGALAQDHATTVAALRELRALYLAQDLDGLNRHQRALARTRAVARALDDLLEQLLYRRSERMAANLGDDLRAGGAFVAVGALHLHGARGLPALAARAGHKVEPVVF
jgi:uncharacterized protein YbaP (TraB family)